MNKIKDLKSALSDKTAFIFDMDGTLVDLENLNFTTFETVIKEKFNKPFTQEEYQQYFSGAGSRNGFIKYLEVHTLAHDIDQLVESYRVVKREILYTRLTEVVTLKEGARELLQLLKSKGYKTALATSSFKEFAQFIMKSFDLFDFFDEFLTESDIIHNKPNPEIFNLAQERLGVPKEKCVIFEDSINGIKSALASDMLCIGLHTPGINDGYINIADMVIKNYFEVIEAIA